MRPVRTNRPGHSRPAPASMAGERTETFTANRLTVPWPPEPLRFAAGAAIRQGMRWQDRWCERDQPVA